MIFRTRLARALTGLCLLAAVAAGPAAAPAAAAGTDCLPTWDVVAGSALPPLHGVDALSTTDVWAVGDGAGSQATTVQFDGADWTEFDAPVPAGAGATNSLTSVDALATADVWAVGSAEDVTRPMIEHWDGVSWHLVSSPAPPQNVTYVLQTIRARTAADIWAGGYRFNPTTGGTRHALIEHWNGTSWRVVPPATQSAPVSEIRGFAPLTGTSVWAVGRRAGSGVTNQSLIEKWNGSTWTLSTSPSEGPLNAAAAVTSSDVWAAGANGFAHWTGSSWHAVASATTARGMAVVSATDIWSTGPRFTGGNWRTVTGQLNGARADRYDGVTVGSQTEGWRVGFREDSGIIEHLCAIDVTDAGSIPQDVSGALGATAFWHFDAANTASHSVTDKSGLGLFDTTRPAGGAFTWTLAWAGSFQSIDTTTGLTSVIRVTPTAQPRSGGTSTTFAITWGSAAPPAGDVLEVQIERPGDVDFSAWKMGTATSANFVPDGGTGDYFFRARVTNAGGTIASNWSRNLGIHVT
jgi:hypothetical protein